MIIQATTPIPTNNNQLTNGANYTTMSAVEGKGYQTSTRVNTLIAGKGYQTKADVQALINASGGHLTKKVVNSLPTTGQENIIYLVPKSSSEAGNVYDEYQWISNKWELMGDSKIDLSNYYNTSNLIPLTEAEIDAICV